MKIQLEEFEFGSRLMLDSKPHTITSIEVMNDEEDGPVPALHLDDGYGMRYTVDMDEVRNDDFEGQLHPETFNPKRKAFVDKFTKPRSEGESLDLIERVPDLHWIPVEIWEFIEAFDKREVHPHNTYLNQFVSGHWLYSASVYSPERDDSFTLRRADISGFKMSDINWDV